MKLKDLLKAIMLKSSLATASNTDGMAHGIPGNSLIIGSRAYDVNLLFSDEFTQQINNDLAVANGVLYYNLGEGWKDIFSGEEISSEKIASLPNITYFNKDGIQEVY